LLQDSNPHAYSKSRSYLASSQHAVALASRLHPIPNGDCHGSCDFYCQSLPWPYAWRRPYRYTIACANVSGPTAEGHGSAFYTHATAPHGDANPSATYAYSR
jgi:hypothetical protein